VRVIGFRPKMERSAAYRWHPYFQPYERTPSDKLQAMPTPGNDSIATKSKQYCHASAVAANCHLEGLTTTVGSHVHACVHRQSVFLSMTFRSWLEVQRTMDTSSPGRFDPSERRQIVPTRNHSRYTPSKTSFKEDFRPSMKGTTVRVSRQPAHVSATHSERRECQHHPRAGRSTENLADASPSRIQPCWRIELQWKAR